MRKMSELLNPNLPQLGVVWIAERIDVVTRYGTEVFPAMISPSSPLNNINITQNLSCPKRLCGYDLITKDLLYECGPFLNDTDLTYFLTTYKITLFY